VQLITSKWFEGRSQPVRHRSGTVAKVRAASHTRTFRPPIFANVRHSSARSALARERGPMGLL